MYPKKQTIRLQIACGSNINKLDIYFERENSFIFVVCYPQNI